MARTGIDPISMECDVYKAMKAVVILTPYLGVQEHNFENSFLRTKGRDPWGNGDQDFSGLCKHRRTARPALYEQKV